MLFIFSTSLKITESFIIVSTVDFIYILFIARTIMTLHGNRNGILLIAFQDLFKNRARFPWSLPKSRHAKRHIVRCKVI